MLNRMLPLVSLFIVVYLLPACRSAQKLVENGDYDAAVEYCVQKLRGKKNKKTELVQGLELAFAKAQERDLQLAERLINEGHPENWIRINDLYRKIAERQRKVRPLMPLVSKDGYRAKINLVDISTLEHDSRKNAADFLYSQAESLLLRARDGDRAAARQAYDKLRELEKRYFRNYKEKDQMLEEARRLGTSWALLELDNRAHYPLPYGFREELIGFDKSDLDSEWVAFLFEQKNGYPVDYTLQVRLENISVSPERVAERRYSEEKTVKDGWEYVLDENGNVKKDSSGNDIKVDKMKTVRADVVEIFQSKFTTVDATLLVLDASGSRLESRRLSRSVAFENYASTFIGDARALSEESKRRIGNRPLPFPGNEAMLLDVACGLKAELLSGIKNSRSIW